MRIYTSILTALGVALTLSGCMTNPRQAYTANQPKTAPVRNLTNMDLAMGCLDRLLVEYQVKPMYLTSTGLPNRAGGKVELTSGVDMLKTSIGQLSLSNVFRYVDLSALAMTQLGGNANEAGSRPIEFSTIDAWAKFLREHAPDSEFHYPGYVITGSISQMDNTTLSDQAGGGLGSDQILNIGANQDQMVSVVTVDMQVMDSLGLEVKNGLTIKNSLAIIKSGKGMDLSGRIKTVGGYFSVSYDRSEGLHQGIRDLIQLGALELLGRLAKVPYEQCLKPESVSAGALEAAEQAFEKMSEPERIRFVQKQLAALTDSSGFRPVPYYQGAITGILDELTRDAVARYRRQVRLIAAASIDLDLYRSLQNQPAAPSLFSPVRPAPGSGSAPQIQFVSADGQSVLEGKVEYPVGSGMSVGIAADQPAHVHCFLRDSKRRKVFRVFPTSEQPGDTLTPGSAALVPPPNVASRVKFNEPALDELGCIISSQTLVAGNKLPLVPLGSEAVPNVSSLQEVLEQYQKDANGAVIGMSVLRIEVK